MLGLVVFDCDGTLVDSQHAIIAAVQESFAGHGLPIPTEDAIRRIVGLSVPEAIAELLGVGYGHAKIEHLAESFKRSFMARRQRGRGRFEPLFPGMRDTLKSLDKAGLLMAVATGKSQRGARATLASHRIDHHFLSVQTADTHPSKPHPAMLEAAIAECGAEPAHSVIVGDTSYDMRMGHAAGVRRLGVDWGYHPPDELIAAGAEAVIRTPGELAGTILSMLEQDA